MKSPITRFTSLLALSLFAFVLSSCSKKEEQNVTQGTDSTIHSVLFKGKGLAPSIMWLDSKGVVHAEPYFHMGQNGKLMAPQNPSAQVNRMTMKPTMFWKSQRSMIRLAWDTTLDPQLYTSHTIDGITFPAWRNDTTPFELTITDTAVYVYNAGSGAFVHYGSFSGGGPGAGGRLNIAGGTPPSLMSPPTPPPPGNSALNAMGLSVISPIRMPSGQGMHWVTDDAITTTSGVYTFTYGMAGSQLQFSIH